MDTSSLRSNCFLPILKHFFFSTVNNVYTVSAVPKTSTVSLSPLTLNFRNKEIYFICIIYVSGDTDIIWLDDIYTLWPVYFIFRNSKRFKRTHYFQCDFTNIRSIFNYVTDTVVESLHQIEAAVAAARQSKITAYSPLYIIVTHWVQLAVRYP